MTIAVRGSGVAAAGCIRLLQQAGFNVSHRPHPSPAVPVIMLSDAAIALMTDVFGDLPLPPGYRRVNKRIVIWGDAAPVSIAHNAILLSGNELAAMLPAGAPQLPDNDPAGFVVEAGPAPDTCRVERFGQRDAAVAHARYIGNMDRDACIIEAVHDGWLFLVPDTGDAAWLMAVGGEPEALLEQSRYARTRVVLAGEVSARFDTSPRRATPLCGPGWLACGTRSLAFDPICGDGTAQAVREAILVAAVTAALHENMSAEALYIHYESMLTGAMRRHLHLAAQFYFTGGSSAWWQNQYEATIAGHAQCTGVLAKMPEPRFILDGLRLSPRERAA